MNQEDITEEGKPIYDLEERTFQFAKRVRMWVKKLPRSIANDEDARQLVKASGSVGANYIEANEALSKKDFVYRVRVCRKEAKESAYWTRLILESNDSEIDEIGGKALYNEAVELKRYFPPSSANLNNKAS